MASRSLQRRKHFLESWNLLDDFFAKNSGYFLDGHIPFLKITRICGCSIGPIFKYPIALPGRPDVLKK